MGLVQVGTWVKVVVVTEQWVLLAGQAFAVWRAEKRGVLLSVVLVVV